MAPLKVALVISAIIGGAFSFSLRFNGTEGIKARVGAIAPCAELENPLMEYKGGKFPEEVPLPGTISVNMAMTLHEEIPDDLIVKLDLNRLDPFTLHVPCIGGVGSCEYSACDILKTRKEFCEGFPEGEECKCPMPVGEYNFVDVQSRIDDMGFVMDTVMRGKYKAKMTFFPESDHDYLYGCFDFDFTFVEGDQ